MIDESYCWVVAISNRREYIENELAAESSTMVLSFSDGMHLTNGRHRRKIFRDLRPDMWATIAAREMPQPPVSMDLTLRVMGDKSPKATHKHAVQKQVNGERRKAGEEQSRQRQASSEDEKIKGTLFAVGTRPRTRKQPLGPQRADSN